MAWILGEKFVQKSIITLQNEICHKIEGNENFQGKYEVYIFINYCNLGLLLGLFLRHKNLNKFQWPGF